ncbi:hypothetical protein QN391_25540, partial [Pseudomonas sp. CCI1.2]
MNKLDEDQPYFQASSRMPLNAIVLFRGKELMAWTTKALPHPTLAGNIMMAVVFSLLVGVIL